MAKTTTRGLGLLGILLAACSAGQSTEEEGTGASGPAAGNAAATSSAAGPSSSSSGFAAGGGDEGGGPSCPACSADLHDIIDCDGNVVETCPPDQGCSADGCVPACESAAANQSTIGCDYFVMGPDAIPEAVGRVSRRLHHQHLGRARHDLDRARRAELRRHELRAHPAG
jgi:hypothetical protein